MNKPIIDLKESNSYNEMLNRAWEIHRSILPVDEHIKFGKYDIYNDTVFANNLGGDHRAFVDFSKRYDLDEILWIHQGVMSTCDYKKRIGLFIADVSGHEFEDLMLVHNLHSALFTALPYELEKNGEVTEQLFDILNMRLFNSTPPEKFVTAIYLELGLDRSIRMLIAGHPQPLVYNLKEKEFENIALKLNPPLGLLPSKWAVDEDPDVDQPQARIEYKINEFFLPRESVAVLYTDGIIEVTDKSDEQFGTERLKQLIKAGSHLSSREIFNTIMKATDEFCHDRDILDDRTLMIIKCCEDE